MRTRSGNVYPMLTGSEETNTSKKLKSSVFHFNRLPNDAIVAILACFASTATCPADFLIIMLICKRMNDLGLESSVLSELPCEAFAVKPKKWSESAFRFLNRCSDAGNVEASYTLGMIQFYAFQQWDLGLSLMKKAASKNHAPALYSLAVIDFNGSGSLENKNLISGISFCSRAASLGHIDALRELGYCYNKGFGVGRNFREGKRLLVEANERELAFVGIPVHPANRFLVEWFADKILFPEIQMCSHADCGRLETRKQEFQRCPGCSTVCYCSRSCRALDWKIRHLLECERGRRFYIGNPEDGNRIWVGNGGRR